MSDARTDPDHAPRAAAVDPTGRLTAAEVAAIEAVRDAPARARQAEVDGFAMDHERWGTLREGVTGDLYSVISAYKELEEHEENEEHASPGATASAKPAGPGASREDPQPD
jgi:hypothetical protein